MASPRPQPRFPEPDSQPFWEATKRHQLSYQTCNRCNSIIFYPRRHCTNCGCAETTLLVSRGQGSLYTFTVIMQSQNPAFRELCPYAVAYVDLDEGFRIMTNIVGVQDPLRDIRCGMRVRVRWQDQGEGGVSLPMFELA